MFVRDRHVIYSMPWRPHNHGTNLFIKYGTLVMIIQVQVYTSSMIIELAHPVSDKKYTSDSTLCINYMECNKCPRITISCA